jgi:hypothetical protein
MCYNLNLLLFFFFLFFNFILNVIELWTKVDDKAIKY